MVRLIPENAMFELKNEVLDNIDAQCIDFESVNSKVKDENIAILRKLEDKYISKSL